MWSTWVILLGVLFCLTMMLLNALLYANHPHGRGLNLGAAIWCAVMGGLAAWSLGQLAGLQGWWRR